MTDDGTTRRIVGAYGASMGDPTPDGEPVTVDPSRADVDKDGWQRMPVTSHRCPSCGGELWWDDGTKIDAPPGAVCECGTTVATTPIAAILGTLLDRVDAAIAAIPAEHLDSRSDELREHATEIAVEQVDLLTDSELEALDADERMAGFTDTNVLGFVQTSIGKDETPELQRAIARVCDLVYQLVLRDTFTAAVRDRQVGAALDHLKMEFRRVGGFHPDDDASELRNARDQPQGTPWRSLPLTFTTEEAARVAAAIDTVRAAGIDPSAATLPIAYAEGWL